MSWKTDYPCGCSLDGRCEAHQQMMSRIYDAWQDRASTNRFMVAIYAESDGYGEPGTVPAQGYDWSGIRDSSPEAVERMAAVVNRKG